MDLRCSTKLHAVLLDGGLVEVKCGSRYCGAVQGIVVLHRFSTTTGELVDTLRFKDPAQKGKAHGTDNHSAAVRPA